MANLVRFDRGALQPEQCDTSTWPMVDIKALDDDQRARFYKRLTAVQEFLHGKPCKDISATLKISRQEILRLVKRCLVRHEDERIWGARALLDHQHQKPYQRTKLVGLKHIADHGGMAGALTQLFDRYSDVKKMIDDIFLNKCKRGVVTESRMPVKALQKKMLDALRTEGVRGNEYPFNAKYLAGRALSNYLLNLYRTRTKSAVRARDGEEAAKLLKTGEGNNQGVHADAPYRRTEFDGHRIDGIFIIEMPHPLGGTHMVVLDRLWLLVIVDSHTRAVLGYFISLNREYTEGDVLECIKRTVTPWSPMMLTIRGLTYRDGSGLPSGVIPRCAWACWEELLYDNAKANLSKLVTTNLREFIGCAINAGPVKTPTCRPLVERFFQTLEENGYHRLPSTTGSNPDDSRRDAPEEQAMRYHIHVQHLYELTDVLIAEYNSMPHTSLGYRSPLEQMQYFANDPDFFIRTLEEDKRNKIGRGILNVQIRRKVRGNIKQGRRPFVELEGARYTSEILARNLDLIGEYLTLHIDSDDLRAVTAYLDNGAEFGALTAQGNWSRTPHSLEMRRAINRLSHRKMLAYTQHDDPVGIYLKHLEEQSVTNKHARAQYEKSRQTISRSSQLSPQSDSPIIEDSSSPPPVRALPRPVKKCRIL